MALSQHFFHLHPWHPKYLPQAAELVSQRYLALRRQIAVLPPQYQHPSAIRGLLQELPAETAGVVALENDRLVGFLLGMVIPSFLGKRSIYSPVFANAAEPQNSSRIYEELYAALSDQWIKMGCFTHLVSLLSDDLSALKGWHWLGFGMAAVDSVRPLQPVDEAIQPLQIHQAGLENASQLQELVHSLERHLASAPVFWLHEHPDIDKWLRQPGNVAFLAVDKGQVVGYMALELGGQVDCALLQDAKTVAIGGAYTLPEWRSRGVATALLNHALEWSAANGAQRIVADFEAMNILAARFWLRHFTPVSFSLMRVIDERVGNSN